MDGLELYVAVRFRQVCYLISPVASTVDLVFSLDAYTSARISSAHMKFGLFTLWGTFSSLLHWVDLCVLIMLSNLARSI